MNLRTKLNLLTVLPTVLCAAGVLISLSITSRRLEKTLKAEAEETMKQEISFSAKAAYDLIRTQNESAQVHLRSSLSTAFEYLKKRNNIRFEKAAPSHTWKAVNESNRQQITEVSLPTPLLEGKLVNLTDDPNESVPAADDLKSRVNASVGLFQRMNGDGDMLNVATTITTAAGRRSIGLFIPRRLPDGVENPVIASILKNEDYISSFLYDGKMYLAGFKAIQDEQKNVVGMVLVGFLLSEYAKITQETIKSIVVGKTGYVFILGASDHDLGHYIVSKGGTRDGENIYESKDADGRYFIRDLIEDAEKAGEGNFGVTEYTWQNQGEAKARKKTAASFYYKPWQWVVSGSAYNEEFEDSLQVTMEQVDLQKKLVIAISILIGLSGAVLSYVLSDKISNTLIRKASELKDISSSTATIAENVFSQLESLNSASAEQSASASETSASMTEMGTMVATTANNTSSVHAISEEVTQKCNAGIQTVGNLADSMNAIQLANTQLENISKIIYEISNKTKIINDIVFKTQLLSFNASIEAARAGEHGRGFSVVAEEVGNLAQLSGSASREIYTLVDNSKKDVASIVENIRGKIAHGNSVAQEVLATFSDISKRSSDLYDDIKKVSQATQQQSLGIKQVEQAILQINEAAASSRSNINELSGLAGNLRDRSSGLLDVVGDIMVLTTGVKDSESEKTNRSESSGDTAKIVELKKAA